MTKELSRKEAAALLAGRKTRHDQGLEDLLYFLMNQDDGVYRGTTDELALAMTAVFGRPYDGVSVRDLIAIVRSRDHIEANGWTVPYVGNGNQDPTYLIVDTKGDVPATQEGIARRAKDMVNLADRLLCQSEVLAAQTDGRTQVGKHARYTVGQMRATRDNMEIMVAQLNHA